MKNYIIALLLFLKPSFVIAWENTCSGSMRESGMSSWQIYLECYPELVMGSILFLGMGLFLFMYLKRKK